MFIFFENVVNALRLSKKTMYSYYWRLPYNFVKVYSEYDAKIGRQENWDKKYESGDEDD